MSSAAPAGSFSLVEMIVPLSSRAIVGGVCGRAGGAFGGGNGFEDEGGRLGSDEDASGVAPAMLVSEGARERPERTLAASTKEEKLGSEDESGFPE